MKILKIALVVSLLGMFLLPGLLAPSISEAATVYRTVTVIKTGPGGSGTYMMLGNATFPLLGGVNAMWFNAHALKQKEQLAVSLTALVNGMSLEISWDDALPGTPVIRTMYLKETAP